LNKIDREISSPILVKITPFDSSRFKLFRGRVQFFIAFLQLELHVFLQVWVGNPHSQQYNIICFLANRQRQLPTNHNKKYIKLILKTY